MGKHNSPASTELLKQSNNIKMIIMTGHKSLYISLLSAPHLTLTLTQTGSCLFSWSPVCQSVKGVYANLLSGHKIKPQPSSLLSSGLDLLLHTGFDS